MFSGFARYYKGFTRGSALDHAIAENQSAEPNDDAPSAPSLFGWPILVIIAAALAVVLPFIYWGNPSGHDFEFHMNSWMEVLSQWKQGVIYPGWAGLAHYGYGEARFIFYPPISWTLGAILGALLPWAFVPAAYIWIALTLSGCTMFLLSRTWLDRNDAIFAAVFYAANPYYLIIIYWRSAFAELLAGALLPLLALFVWRSSEGRREVIPLALVVTAAWLTNIPAAVMLTYSLGLLVVAWAISERSPRAARDSILAVVIAAALAAFYLLPAIYEQRWINIAQVVAPGLRPEDNFLFTAISDSDHNRFNFLVSLVALSEIAALVGAIVLSRKRELPHSVLRCFALWSLASLLLMFPLTSAAWKHFPDLTFVQMPWRWLLCLNVAFALFLAAAWRRWTARLLVYSVLLMMLAFVWHRVQRPWWDRTIEIAQMRDNQRTGHGYEGTDEYVPTGADGYEISQNAPPVAGEDASPVQLRIQKWDSQSKIFTAKVSRPTKLNLRLFNYPAWKVEVNNRVTSVETGDVTGQMVLPIQPGLNSVRITFARTWDRTLGILISIVAALVVFIFALRQRRRGFSVGNIPN